MVGVGATGWLEFSPALSVRTVDLNVYLMLRGSLRRGRNMAISLVFLLAPFPLPPFLPSHWEVYFPPNPSGEQSIVSRDLRAPHQVAECGLRGGGEEQRRMGRVAHYHMMHIHSDMVHSLSQETASQQYGGNLLDMFYKEPTRWAYTFQVSGDVSGCG